jgi:hypothetical protein
MEAAKWQGKLEDSCSTVYLSNGGVTEWGGATGAEAWNRWLRSARRARRGVPGTCKKQQGGQAARASRTYWELGVIFGPYSEEKVWEDSLGGCEMGTWLRCASVHFHVWKLVSQASYISLWAFTSPCLNIPQKTSHAVWGRLSEKIPMEMLCKMPSSAAVKE